jgi:hypothetical protein
MQANDHCHYIGFCPLGVEECGKSDSRYPYKLSIEIDPLPNDEKGTFAILTLYFDSKRSKNKITRYRSMAGKIISILAYTVPILTKKGNTYPLPVIEDIEILDAPDCCVASEKPMLEKEEDDEKQ